MTTKTFILFLAALFLALVSLRGVWGKDDAPGIIDHYASHLVYPVLAIQHRCISPIKAYFKRQEDVALLNERIKGLESERETLLSENIELNGMIAYAQETDELREFKKNYDCATALVCQVLSKHFSDQSHYFLVDGGSNRGIEPGMVVVYKDFLLGKVVEVYSRYCKVLLITDRLCKVAATCTKSKASGIYEGVNKEWAAAFNHVSHLADVEVGDLILSSGEGLLFPRGFGLGRVKSFTTNGLFHEIIVEPLIDVRGIDYCCLLQKIA